MLVVDKIIGDVEEPRFAERRTEYLLVDSVEASKRRFRSHTDAGTDIAIDLKRGSYLRHGAVLYDYGEKIIAVERKPEEAMVVRLSAELEASERLARAVRIAHAFGNQHVPLEIEGEEIRIPITTSREIAAETARETGVIDEELHFGKVQLGLKHPLLAQGHSH